MSSTTGNGDDIFTAAMDASHPLWLKEWTEGAGESTIRKHSNKNNKDDDNVILQCYCSWFCPFAQRAWIMLEEIGVPYHYHEVNPYKVDPKEPGGYTKQSLSMIEKRALLPDFMDTSPRGLVPAIQDVKGQRIWESAVVMEYLDQVYGDNRLYNKDAEAAALIRINVDHCTSRIQKAYYQFLMTPTNIDGQQTKVKQEFFRECRALACAMAPNSIDPQPEEILKDTQKAMHAETETTGTMQRVDVGTLSQVSQEALVGRLKLQPGPFFLGQQFSAVDISLAPFWQRILWVGQRYRDLSLPKDAAFDRLNQWWAAVSQRPSVANTLVGKERLISSYNQYASNVATSDFATTMQSSLQNGPASKKQKV